MPRHAGWLLVLVLVTATGPARADSAKTSPSSLYFDWLHGWSQGLDLAGREAMTIGLDPETGAWRLAPSQAPPGLQLSMAPTEIRTQRADGGVAVTISPGLIEYIMARRGPGGLSGIRYVVPGDPIPSALDPTSDWPVK
jgi:hypothetical protein